MLFRATSIAATFVAVLQSGAVFAHEPVDRGRVIAFLETVQLLSLEEGREFCGYIVRVRDKVRATPPIRGKAYECLPREPLANVEIIASYHTHGRFADDADSEVPSVDDMLGDREEGIDGYIVTPGGRVWFHDVDKGVVDLICALECVTADPEHDDSYFDPVAPRYTLEELSARFFDQSR